MSDDACLFCRIVAGEVPAERVFETDSVLAFRDIEPQAPVHLLVIPKAHHPTLSELAEAAPEVAAQVLTAARTVAQQEGIGAGYRLVANNGAQAQQSVFHAHVHVLGGRDFTWPPG